MTEYLIEDHNARVAALACRIRELEAHIQTRQRTLAEHGRFVRSEERARIRRELRERIDGLTVYMTGGLPVDEPFVVTADLIAALDRICPDGTA